MNTTFSKDIRGRHFNFHPLEIADKTGYHVNVKDEEGNRWEFRFFAETDHQFKVQGENLPDWLTELESDLNAAVNEHE